MVFCLKADCRGVLPQCHTEAPAPSVTADLGLQESFRGKEVARWASSDRMGGPMRRPTALLSSPHAHTQDEPCVGEAGAH